MKVQTAARILGKIHSTIVHAVKNFHYYTAAAAPGSLTVNLLQYTLTDCRLRFMARWYRFCQKFYTV